jgi:hypothetical protein
VNQVARELRVAPAVPAAANEHGPPTAWWRPARIIPDLERRAGVVRAVQTPAGRVAVVLAFAALAWLRHQPLLAAGCALPVLFPARRRLWVGVATLALLLLGPTSLVGLVAVAEAERVSWHGELRWVTAAAIAAALLLTAGYVQFAKTRGARWLHRRPVATFVALQLVLLALVGALPLSGAARVGAWALAAALGRYLWYGAYALKDRVDRRGRALAVDATAWWPFWGSTPNPLPKPGSFLDRIEVATPAEAAVWQLKGIKLLAWAQILAVVRAGYEAVAVGDGPFALPWVPCLRMPELSEALARSVAGSPLPFHANWAAVAHAFVSCLLDFAIAGHVVIAGARMAGFKALRNMYRPLAARSLADFWNRFDHYFKELLVELFFFPAYLRWFKKHPRLRMAAATFAAAGFGNFLYHFVEDFRSIATWGFLGALRARQAYGAYCVVLAAGIAWSQLRAPRSPRAAPSWAALLRTRAGIVAFFLLLIVPNAAAPGTTISQCAAFYRALLP